jgi:hypothetical protein
MAYLKPPAFTRHLANPLAMRLSARGVATLTVVGRRTGDPHKVPVIPIEVGQSRYLVSPYGESDWVRHYRAAGTGELSRKGQTEVYPQPHHRLTGRSSGPDQNDQGLISRGLSSIDR